MSRLHLACCLAAAVLLGGCSLLRGRTAPTDASLAGQTLRMETRSGAVTLLRFAEGGRVSASSAGRSWTGRWRIDDRRLCFFWPGAPRECWPYRAPLERGRTRGVTSDRGNLVRVTRL